MGAGPSNSSTAILNSTNQLLQVSNQSCWSECKQNLNNVTVDIAGSKITGGINFSQSCNATSTCVMNSSLDAQVENIMKAMSDQTAVNQVGLFGLGLGSATNSSYIAETITNQITQVMNSTCQANVIQDTENIVTALQGDTVSGGVNFTQSGGAIANCTMTNTARAVAINQQSTEQTQKAKVESVFAMIVIAIVICIIVVGGMVLVFVMHKKQPPPPAPSVIVAK